VSVLSGVSQPLLSLPSQLPQPLLQVSMRHVPVEQVAVALVREQVTPHPPQFVSVLSGVSQPLLSLPSQLPQPLLQVSMRHVPVEQVAVAFVREQATRQAPQSVSESRGVSQPSASMPSQFPQPGSQDAITHIEEEHASTALGSMHACPQPPQCMGSKRVSTQSEPQRTKGEGQTELQVPMMQNWSAEHIRPHPPQCRSSVWRSTHSEPQRV
jgi:hypothetical protein